MIRAFRDGDVPAVRELFYELVPELPVGSEAAVRHWLASQPERAAFLGLVAEEDGAVVGWGHAARDWHTSVRGAARAWAGVLPGHRDRGIGTALAAALDGHLRTIAARSVEAFAHRGSPGQAFAERRGYRETRVEIYSAVAPKDVDLAGLHAVALPEGMRLVPLRELHDRPRELHALDAAVAADVPNDHPEDDLRFDEWCAGIYRAPGLDWDGSRVVLDGDRPVAFTLLQVDRERGRAENDFTATLPEYRGRGLATLLKLASLAWAAEQGIAEVATGNDETNAPMLAVNRRLGYRETVRRARLVKSLR